MECTFQWVSKAEWLKNVSERIWQCNILHMKRTFRAPICKSRTVVYNVINYTLATIIVVRFENVIIFYFKSLEPVFIFPCKLQLHTWANRIVGINKVVFYWNRRTTSTCLGFIMFLSSPHTMFSTRGEKFIIYCNL